MGMQHRGSLYRRRHLCSSDRGRGTDRFLIRQVAPGPPFAQTEQPHGSRNAVRVGLGFVLAIFFGLDGLVCFLLAGRLANFNQTHAYAWWSFPSRGVWWYRTVGVLLVMLAGFFALLAGTPPP